MVTQMQIGLVVQLIAYLPVVSCSHLGVLRLHGATKKQPTVALSSIEAEYRGTTVAACEVAWLQMLLHELDIQVQRPVVIYCDNLNNIHLA